MAATKTLIFTGITIGSNTYDKHLVESAEVTLEPLTTLVDDGQTLNDAYDVSFQVDLYEDGVLADANVNADGGSTKATIKFNGATGAQSLEIADVIINATLVFDNQRTAVRLTGTKRAVSIANAIDLNP